MGGGRAASPTPRLTHRHGPSGQASRVLNRLARLQGPLPAWPGAGRAMPALQFLMLDSNWNLTGQLSAQWGAPLSMSRLSVLSARDCNLGGTLPSSWPTQLPELQVLDLTNNLVMGETQTLTSASHSELQKPLVPTDKS